MKIGVHNEGTGSQLEVILRYKMQMISSSCNIRIPSPFVEPPVMVQQPLQYKSAAPGETLRLECELSKESSEVTWLKENDPLHPGKKYQIVSEGKRQILLIHDVSADDEATYSCVTTSGTKTSATVSLGGKPLLRCG